VTGWPALPRKDARERVAAKQVLSELLLSDLRNNPAVPYEEDCVTRLIQDNVNEAVYKRIQHWSVGELREYILGDTASPEELEVLRKGLTSEMVAAVAKICSNGDLIYGAKLLPVVTRANTTLGLPGRFSSRLQPNDTRDDIRSISAQIYEGLSYGSGDAVIGVNPVTDNVESVTRILHQVYEVIEKYQIPTQGCVLAHISTQMEAVRKGAPIGLLFQSICGSEKGLKEFGISLAMLDEAADVGRHYSRVAGGNCLYFETGQGSALSANAHHGADQVTMEARNYGLARHYSPFIVNTVVGFIGPEYLYNSREILRAGLEDHFMGKLSGIAMGCDCCYTNHADADQNSNESLLMLMATAGCNFVIAMPLGDDIMLNYQTCSFHDIATVRQTLGLRPAPEFERWLEARGLMANGKLTRAAGDPSLFF
jgi:ethanolamine ammonia-lyase large subunit